MQNNGPSGAENDSSLASNDPKDAMGQAGLPNLGSNKLGIVHGFELIREEPVPEIRATASLYRHLKSGALVLSIPCDDDNKTFTAMFRTPPPDSSGMTHILEHSVLEGSERYPLKDLFKQLSKSSLNTYLNASTGSDRTYYPAASQNGADFENLVRVYLDAVFHPSLTRETFLQEGWHYESAKPGDPLEYKGVVFNEMKGACASPSRVLFVTSKSALFPDTPYAHDSGGSPRAIPTLDYDTFRRYHETYYHPSNSLLFFYGNDDPVRRLEIADEALAGFEARKVDSAVPLQPAFDAPRTVVAPYAAEEGDLTRKAYVTECWALPEISDPETVMAIEILDHILTSNSAAPLHKALLESGLGEGIAAHGLHSGQRQLWFATGLKGTSSASADAVAGVIRSCFETLARDGIDPDLIQASLNSYEFDLRECDTGGDPRGLAHMHRVMGSWMYDRDPIEGLRYETALGSIKARLAAGERIFEELIERHFLENTHRVRVILEPDAGLQKRQNDAEQADLRSVEASLTKEELDRIRAEAAALAAYQQTADTPEVLATLPRLAVSDLKRDQDRLPIETENRNGVEVVRHGVFTNDIAYVRMGLRLDAVRKELLPYVPLFASCLRRMDTASGDYVQLARKIGIHTGGIGAEYDAFAVRGSADPAGWLFLGGKAMSSKVPEMISLMQEMLFTGNLDNQVRFLELVKERKAGLESSLVANGIGIVSGRLDAHFQPSARMAQQMDGVDHLDFLKALVGRVSSDWPAVRTELEEVRDSLLRKEALLCDVTIEDSKWPSIAAEIDRFVAGFPSNPSSPRDRAIAEPSSAEGFSVASTVNFVGKAFNAYDAGYQYHGSIMAIRELVNSGWLWDKVRVQGGAYGSRMAFDRTTGIVSFVSWRDPNLGATLEVFDQAAKFLETAPFSSDQIDQAVISAIGRLDSYLLPKAKGRVALARHLRGIDEASLQQARDELLSTSIDDVRRFADVLANIAKSGRVVVMGGKEALAATPGLQVKALS